MEPFDLIQAPDRIRPEFVFDALFLGVGPGLLLLAIFVLRRAKGSVGYSGDRIRNLAWFLVPFSTIWICFTGVMCGEDVRHAYAVRSDVQQGRYMTLEGCLDRFHPGLINAGRTTAGNERWAVGGHEFSYGNSQMRFAYHRVEPWGGLVHADSRVQVSFVPDEFLGRDDIVRLRVEPHACPPVGDIG